MPLARYLAVNNAGGGDHTTVTAALAAAVAGGATVNTPWTIEVFGGNYGERITVPAGVTLKGQGMGNTTILATGGLPHKIHAGAFVRGLYLINVNGPIGVEAVMDGGGSVMMESVKIYCNYSADVGYNGAVVALQMTGASENGFLQIDNFYLYARNKIANASAKAVGFHTAPGCASNIESGAGRIKTSVAASGAQAKAIACWNQGASSYAGVLGGPQVEFSPIYSATAYMLVNENASNPDGGFLGMSVNGTNTVPLQEILIDNPYATGASDALGMLGHHMMLDSLTMRRSIATGYELEHAGTKYPIVPTIVMNRAPTGADAAPENTLWIVKP